MIVFVAMSGGVDSAVAAALLIDDGHEVVGVSAALWDAPEGGDRVCSDHRNAARVAAELGIPHHRLDLREEFRHDVVGPFLAEYERGRTPNPCVACNGRFKLGALVDWARGEGADAVATGHYARRTRTDGRTRLLRARDEARDQSYFLFGLSSERLECLLFPVGELRKDDVRAEARRRGLSVAERPDSQDLCFGSPRSFLAREGRGGRAGRIVDRSGQALGGHDGVEGFTVGQRRGLGVSADRRLYVHAIDADRREVVVDRERPSSRGVVAGRWNWLAPAPSRDEVVLAQTRSRQSPLPARVAPRAEGEVEVLFAETGSIAAPGQAVVVYRGDEVLGGGWIERPLAA